jgi:hypothetical protein
MPLLTWKLVAFSRKGWPKTPTSLRSLEQRSHSPLLRPALLFVLHVSATLRAIEIRRKCEVISGLGEHRVLQGRLAVLFEDPLDSTRPNDTSKAGALVACKRRINPKRH